MFICGIISVCDVTTCHAMVVCMCPDMMTRQGHAHVKKLEIYPCKIPLNYAICHTLPHIFGSTHTPRAYNCFITIQLQNTRIVAHQCLKALYNLKELTQCINEIEVLINLFSLLFSSTLEACREVMMPIQGHHPLMCICTMSWLDISMAATPWESHHDVSPSVFLPAVPS